MSGLAAQPHSPAFPGELCAQCPPRGRVAEPPRVALGPVHGSMRPLTSGTPVGEREPQEGQFLPAGLWEAPTRAAVSELLPREPWQGHCWVDLRGARPRPALRAVSPSEVPAPPASCPALAPPPPGDWQLLVLVSPPVSLPWIPHVSAPSSPDTALHHKRPH